MQQNLKLTFISTLLSTLALPILAFAQTSSSSTASTTPNTTGTTTQSTCMQLALDKRENALISGHDAYNGAVKAAIAKRLTDLKSSWDLSDKKLRIEKRLLTYKNFKTEMQSATTLLRTTKNISWKTYQADAKVCGIKGTGELPTPFTSLNNSL